MKTIFNAGTDWETSLTVTKVDGGHIVETNHVRVICLRISAVNKWIQRLTPIYHGDLEDGIDRIETDTYVSTLGESRDIPDSKVIEE